MKTKAEIDLEHIVTLMQGMLASGHYTSPTYYGDEEEPAVKKLDNGVDWKDMCERRFESYVILEAIALFRELESVMQNRNDEGQ